MRKISDNNQTWKDIPDIYIKNLSRLTRDDWWPSIADAPTIIVS